MNQEKNNTYSVPYEHYGAFYTSMAKETAQTLGDSTQSNLVQVYETEYTKKTIIYIQGSDHNGAFATLHDLMDDLAHSPTNSYRFVIFSSKTNFNFIKCWLHDNINPSESVQVIAGFHGSPSVAIMDHYKISIDPTNFTFLPVLSNDMLEHDFPYYHKIKIHEDDVAYTADLLEALNEGLGHRPYDIILASCYGGLAAKDAEHLLPEGSRFFSYGHERMPGGPQGILENTLQHILDKEKTPNFSFDHIHKVESCIANLPNADRMYVARLYHAQSIGSSGIRYELRDEVGKLSEKGFMFDEKLRTKIHEAFAEAEEVCGAEPLHSMLEKAMDTIEKGSFYGADTYLASLMVTKEILGWKDAGEIYMEEEGASTAVDATAGSMTAWFTELWELLA